MLKKLLFPALLMAASLLGAASASWATTTVTGSITSNSTWTLSGSPYYLPSAVTVSAGVTLNIDPGVVVKFGKSSGLTVYGTVNANGTADNAVYFTDYRDDKAGGDTNNDGNASDPAPGGWNGINVYNGGNATLAYTTVRYGGTVYQTGTGNLTLTNCTVSDSKSNGIDTESASGALTVKNSTFSNNASFGMRLWAMTGLVTVSGNSLDRVFLDASTLAGFSGNTCSDHIEIHSGAITRDTTLEPSITYLVNWTFAVNSGATLTAPAGTVVKLNGTVINVNGTLNANGTAANPVYFTDYRDDSVGTNVDGGAGSPAPGGWNGINVYKGGNATLAYTTVRYGGTVYQTGTGNLTLTNCTVSDSKSYGIQTESASGSLTVKNSTFSNNASFGIRLWGMTGLATVSGNSLDRVFLDASTLAGFSGNTCSDHIEIHSGAITRDTTLEPSITYLVNWTFAVNSGATLTAPAGTVVKLNGTVINVNGTLNANGTAANPVYFTDYRDDSVGTNVDGGAGSPAPGGWNGINVYNGGNATLAYTTVRYGGTVYQTGTGNLTLTNCTVSDSKSNGIDTESASGTLTVKNSTFSNNASFGMRLWGMTGLATVSGNTLDRVYLNASTLAGFSGNTCSDHIEIHSGAITRDTTLEPSITYLVNWTFAVNSGATLTAPAGTVVKLNGTAINVNGTLNANGTAANPVYFTDYRDDSVGTNVDGGAGAPAPGGWNSINVYNGGNATLAYTTVRYGGTVYQTGTGNLTLTNCTVSDSKSYGIQTESASGALTVKNSTFSNNAGYGIRIWGMTGPTTVSGNTLDRVYLNASTLAGFSGNNCSDHIEISGGTIAQNTSLEGGITYLVDAGVTDQANVTLTAPAGTVVKLRSGVSLTINGSLSATGTAANPVYFTDYRDDSVGGDTNGDGGATLPAPGGWGGITVADGASASFANTTIRYGGSSNAAELYKTGSGTLTVANSSTVSDSSSSGMRIYSSAGSYSITDSMVRDNANYGIYLQSSAGPGTVSGNTIRKNARGISVSGTGTNPKVSRNTLAGNVVGVYCETGAAPLIGGATADGNNFLNNTLYGVQNLSSGTVQATYNWWGAAGGPRHPSNPLGTGDAVSDNVAFGTPVDLPAVPIAIGKYTPSEKYFQHVSVGLRSAPQTFSVGNSGNQSLLLGKVALAGDNPADFVIKSDTCSGASIPAGAECSVSVVFAPTANSERFRTALLEFPSNDVMYSPAASVDLSGYGAPPLAPLPFQEDFTGGYSNYWAMWDADQTKYNLNPENLRIYSSNGDLSRSAANILMLPIPSGIGRMMVTARVGFPTLPSGETQQGGIALMAEQFRSPDFGNLVTASYGFSGGAPNVQSTADVDGTTSVTANSPANLSSVLLRVIRRDSSYQSLYSTDEGATFIPLGTSSATWDAAYLALFALNGAGSSAQPLPVDFDFVRVEALPVIGATAGVDFGGTVSYQSAPAPQRNVSVTNSGSGDLVISSLTISGTDSAVFAMGPGSCGPLPITIHPQGSCDLAVTLATSSLGAKSARLAIDSNDIDHQEVLVPLNGTLVDTTPPSVTFSASPYSNSLTVPLSLGATDNVSVTGYLVSESSATPQASGSGWTLGAPTAYQFNATGSKVLYAWAKDAAGNVSLLRWATVTVDTAPPVLSSFTATVKGNSTTAVISGLGATDDLTPVAYAISASPVVPNAGWSATPPATYGPIIPGGATIYAFARDAAGNLAAPVAAQIQYVWGVAVQTAGTGGGAVHSAPSAIACVSGSTSGCSANFNAGSNVTLVATPDADSTFDGWTGICINTGDCKTTMDADKAVTATFTLVPLVKIGATPYPTLQAAYDSAVDGAEIDLKEGVLSGSLTASRRKSVTLTGGYNAAYSAAAGKTVIDGKIVVQSGAVRTKGIVTK